MRTLFFFLSLLVILFLASSAPAFADLYNNGAINGTGDAYFMDIYMVTDSFVPNATGNITSFNAGIWTPTGATPLTVDWTIGTSSFGNDVASGGGAWTSLTLICTNGEIYHGRPCGFNAGFDVYNANMHIADVPVREGQTYWLTLSNASDDFGGRDGWDVNYGRSMAYHSDIGYISSESFSINGEGTGTTPEPTSITLFGSGILGLAGFLRRRVL